MALLLGGKLVAEELKVSLAHPLAPTYLYLVPLMEY